MEVRATSAEVVLKTRPDFLTTNAANFPRFQFLFRCHLTRSSVCRPVPVPGIVVQSQHSARSPPGPATLAVCRASVLAPLKTRHNDRPADPSRHLLHGGQSSAAPCRSVLCWSGLSWSLPVLSVLVWSELVSLLVLSVLVLTGLVCAALCSSSQVCGEDHRFVFCALLIFTVLC